MAKDNEAQTNIYKTKKIVRKSGGGGAYGLGFIGALIYYWQNAHTFWVVILGLLKAAVWPAFLVYHLLKFLKM